MLSQNQQVVSGRFVAASQHICLFYRQREAISPRLGQWIRQTLIPAKVETPRAASLGMALPKIALDHDKPTGTFPSSIDHPEIEVNSNEGHSDRLGRLAGHWGRSRLLLKNGLENLAAMDRDLRRS